MGTIEELKDRVITVNGVSKGFAMTGWRLDTWSAGMIAKACSKIRPSLRTLQHCPSGSRCSRVGGPFDCRRNEGGVSVRRDWMIDGLSAIPD